MILTTRHPYGYWEIRNTRSDLLGWLVMRLEGYRFVPHSPSEISFAEMTAIKDCMQSKTDEYFAEQAKDLHP